MSWCLGTNEILASIKHGIAKVKQERFETAILIFHNFLGGTRRQFLGIICSQDDLRSRIFGTIVVKFLACLPLQGFSKI